jgi:asparagine synthase (glutamine-hydrolysing)
VSLMCRRAAGRVRTFSIGFAESEFDESAAARTVARELGTQHTELMVRPDVEAMFEAVAAMFDEPFADSSAIPTFLVSQLARQSVTVALSGDGGDELFGGYTRYSRTLGGGAGTHAAWRRIFTAMALCMPHFAPGRGRMLDAGRSRWGRYAATVVQPVRMDEGGVAQRSIAAGQRRIEEQLADSTAGESEGDFAASMMRVDLQTYLPGDILTKVDRTSMAVSLEARVPFLDFDLVDFALRIPGAMRVTAQESKRLFRKAITGIVPDAVLRRPKMGFSIPLELWFRKQLRHRVEALRQPSAELREFVDVAAVNRLVFEHVIGRRDHSVMLWRLIVLDNWLAVVKRGALQHPPAVPALIA